MSALFILIIAVAALAVFDALTVRFGVDSRPDSYDSRRSEYPIGIR